MSKEEGKATAMFKSPKLSWQPSNLSPKMVFTFFANFSPAEIPYRGSQGEHFWLGLFHRQYPKQDIGVAYCRHLHAGKPHCNDNDHHDDYSGTQFISRLIQFRNFSALDIAQAVATIDRQLSCAYCNETIEKKEVAIIASRISHPHPAAFHPYCFRCTTCHELISFHIYCAFKNRVYCERHFMEQFLPRCAKCDELITSKHYLNELSQTWHMEHFNCSQCDRDLSGSRYVMRDEKPHCVACFEQRHANVCEECQKPIGIESKDLSYKERHWHEECFVCNKCRVSLVDKPFGTKTESIFCSSCYDMLYGVKCAKCDQVFKSGQRKLEYRNKQWHDFCFVCHKCLAPIGTKSFIPKEDEVFCSNCYESKFATRCVKCCEIIVSNGIVYKDEPWHKECFICAGCSTQLSSVSFLVRQEKPYCQTCYGQRFANKCEQCTKPILGTNVGGTKFITYESRYWHIACFACRDCKTSLEGKGFLKDGDGIICGECAKAKLESEV